jgi:hypothetical protein
MSRTKIVPLSGKKYHLRRLPPEVGSFIFMRMLGVSMRAAQSEAERAPAPKYASKLDTKPAKPEPEPEAKLSGEMRVRALSFAVFSGGISFEDFQFIQLSCMKVVGRIDVNAGVEFPMPVMTDSGQWVDEELADNPGLVMQLTTEVLVFCFADFFGESGTGF